MIQQTSILSYLEQKDSNTLGFDQDQVLQAIVELGEATDREITSYLDYADPNKVRPRRYELVQLGLVQEVDRRKCSITNRQSIVWGLSPPPQRVSNPLRATPTPNIEER